MGIESNVSLIVASLDLQLVRLLRDAIRTTDLSGAHKSHLIAREDAFEPRRHIHPEPQIEPRPRVHPTPRFEPRPVIHPRPRNDPRDVIPAPPCEPERPHDFKSPFEPPWRKVPWKTCPDAHPTARPVIKVAVYKVDTVSKGSLIDFFI